MIDHESAATPGEEDLRSVWAQMSHEIANVLDSKSPCAACRNCVACKPIQAASAPENSEEGAPIWHGTIMSDNRQVGHWRAERRITGDSGSDAYACQVEWTPDGEQSSTTSHSHHEAFLVFHDERDGAVALAAKVLAKVGQTTAFASI